MASEVLDRSGRTGRPGSPAAGPFRRARAGPHARAGPPGRPAARARRAARLVVGWLLVVIYTPESGLRGHAAWFGWDHSDVFFPMFVLTAGMGLAGADATPGAWGRCCGGS
jgi:hypothetical protein